MGESGCSALTEGARTDASVCAFVRERIKAAGLWRIPGVESDESRTHRVSPEPFRLTPAHIDLLQRLGPALVSFYTAVNDLYLREAYPWVNDYLDIGKPDDLCRQARMKYQKRALPPVIRPDILITEDGFSITELDSVPGGIGHLDCLSAAYEQTGFDLIGSPRGMRDAFARMLKNASGNDEPVCAIIVSDESEDYRPEMSYIADELRSTGLAVQTLHPREIEFTEDGLMMEIDGRRKRVDVVYRFFELFDLLNIPKSELLSYAARKKLAVVTPPYKHFLEEKLLLALLHHGALASYWQTAMGEEHFELMKATVAPTWVLDPMPVPPHAEIAGFRWRGESIRDWRAIADGTQKERRLVIKPSGFSPLAWGSRGVAVGQDMSQEDWAAAVENALTSFDKLPWVLQPFHEAALLGVKYLDDASGEVREMQSRMRLCPYYFAAGDGVELAGVLATACPKDKKLIHGMVDAALMPCCVQS